MEIHLLLIFINMNKTKILSVSLPKRVKEELSRVSSKRGKSRSSIVGDALQYYFLSKEFNLLQRNIVARNTAEARRMRVLKNSKKWQEVLRKLNHLASKGKQNVNLADFVHHDRQAH